MNPNTSFILAALAAASLKLLLFPTAPSTDFDVHRHWKALTHSLPLENWYTDDSSQWTLDYPPLFAYLEYLLAKIAHHINPSLVDISDRSYPSQSLRFFMRATVLSTDLIFAPSVYLFIKSISRHKTSAITPAALILFSPALFLIDNIHFQYNALPISLLFLTLTFLNRRQQIPAALSFTLALNLKQTLLPLSPAIALHLLRNAPHTHPIPAILSLIPAAFTALFTTISLWYPFFHAGGPRLLLQITARLFPFHRGLLHAYWAPNFWAPYASLDLSLSRLAFAHRASQASPTSGHIGSMQPFRTLPNPTPAMCTALMVAAAAPALFRTRGISNVVVLALAAFLFGWHVHEKAILLPLLPLAGLAGCSTDDGTVDAFLWLSVGGQFGLFPLMTTAGESVFKIAHFVAYHVFAMRALLEGRWGRRHWLLVAYAVGVFFVEMYAGVGGGHGRLFGDRMPFLPLMMVSLYSFVGVFVAFWKLSTV